MPLTVPDDLREIDHWCLWAFRDRGDRETKVPYAVGGSAGSSTDPDKWSLFEEALQAWEHNPDKYSGIGFVFTKHDPFAGIDLDDCLDAQGDVKPWARGIVERFSDTYMEVSPSGQGLKIWCRGSLPANLPGVRVGNGQIELYDHARFFTVTGQSFRNAPLEIEDHHRDLNDLYIGLTSSRRTKKTWTANPSSTGAVQEGMRHNFMVSVCGTLRRRGVAEIAIEACLQAINTEQCSNAETPEGVKRIVTSSRKWSQQ